MDGFYNGPACPLWLAFGLTVWLMGAAAYAMKNIRILPLEGRVFGISICAMGLIWMPIWFIYGMLTLKFT